MNTMSNLFTKEVLIMLAFTIIAVMVGVMYLKSAASESVEGTSIFDFTVDSGTTSEPVQLSDFKGKKAYLVINVASK